MTLTTFSLSDDTPLVVPDTLAVLAWDALSHPDAIGLTYACRRLLGQAARGKPLVMDAQRTVARIALDVLADDITRH